LVIGRRRAAAGAALALALLGCASPGPPLPAARLLIYGEQHDQPDHQQQVAQVVRALAERGELAAVVVEMAEAGRGTAGLARDSSDAAVREALAWTGWSWDDYAGVVMAAVRAGVPVLGGNLPRAAMRDTMRDAGVDASVSDAARERLAEAVRTGHCDLLPASQLPGMVRIQIARDRSMARTVAQALDAAPAGQRVLLLTGAQHAARDRGVPLHLPPGTPLHVTLFGDPPPDLQADEVRPALRTERPDACEALREQWKNRPGAAPG
jgi:uncharacterized iron-regulated protein